MRLNTLALTVAATISTGAISPVFADESCKLISVSEQVDISRTSPQRCLPGLNPLQGQQWNLLNNGQDAFSSTGGVPGNDLNLWWVHRLGGLGQGVNVAVVDDGLEIAHPDLAANIRPGSKNFSNNSNDPTPSNRNDAHGTSVAGIIGAVDNKIGIKGVAPLVKLQGFNIIATGSQQRLSDFLYALGNSPATADNRLFNQSYGSTPTNSPNSNSLFDQQQDALLESKTLATKDSAVYVKAAGNGFASFGSDIYTYRRRVAEPQIPFFGSNIESAATNFWNTVISAINADGVRASYSSVGSNVFFAAPGGEDGSKLPAHVTTDLLGCNRGYSSTNYAVSNRLHNDRTLDPNCDYNGIMNGTSAATPNATGSLALLISAYPQLSARDFRDIIARSATRIDPNQQPAVLTYSSAAGQRKVTALEGWEKNAAGTWFSPSYGFGLIDVNSALKLAASHTPLPPLVQSPWKQGKPSNASLAAIPDVGSQPTTSAIQVSDALTVEGVQVRINLDHQRVSDLLIELVSPAGTRSVLLNPLNGLIGQAADKAAGLSPSPGLRNYRLLSNKFYGESSAGQWKLQVTDVSNSARRLVRTSIISGVTSELVEANNTAEGKLIDWSIRVLGH
ncbi:S8 family serine peptidase [Pseudomonas sp. 5P_3.1_Bac2]|uniref:S8 family serine peptidase n=1 Tax=Pseudomonas sp. 5P_3.1_Bac2 TaxID=2971617 RepID=UPI0021C7A41A|nr:S8 family serine peptidase [Pseudomonas sp. 5P_3.1_Bac2]MCU1717879.1 S8 family serine peptidase [Pseudomonas sp. 5P_3.1_Bac2]